MATNVRVEKKKGETNEELFRRFKKRVSKSKVLTYARNKRWFVSKSEKRRIAKKKAILKERRRRSQ